MCRAIDLIVENNLVWQLARINTWRHAIRSSSLWSNDSPVCRIIKGSNRLLNVCMCRNIRIARLE
jgi:hypothetical protein